MKRYTFDFMMGDILSGNIEAAYIELLKEHTEDFKPFESALGQSAFQYLDNLTLVPVGKGKEPKVAIDAKLFQDLLLGFLFLYQIHLL